MNYLIKFTLMLALTIQMLSCKKDEATPTAILNENPPSTDLGMVTLQATFASAAHTTSGSAKIYTKDGKRTLVFDNFKTDNGPDLRVYLATNNTASSFREVGRLKSINGNFNYDLASDINPVQYPFVLIWCEDFSVLFGSAELKTPM